MKTKQHNRHASTSIIATCFTVLLLFLLASCASESGGETGSNVKEEPAKSSEPSSQTAASSSDNQTEAAAAPANTEETSVAKTIEAQAAKDAEKATPVVQDVAEPPHIVAECQKEAYVREDKEARTSITKGKDAMEAGVYGVGFKNVDNFKHWSTMHNTVFTGVSRACAKLSECATKHAKDKDKDKLCASEAEAYADWKQTAKEFTEKVHSVRSSQPPELCSSPLAEHDPSYCYEKLGDKIDKVCSSDDCKEAAQCWRSVTILDGAVNQEEVACKYMRIKLSGCNGYKEATHRRVAAFKRCNYLQDKANIKLAPVL